MTNGRCICNMYPIIAALWFFAAFCLWISWIPFTFIQALVLLNYSVLDFSNITWFKLTVYSPSDIPVKSSGHVHVGTCLDTWHTAISPQMPMHGFTHLLATHAKRSLQSSLISHSRRQPRSLSYGFPSNPSKQ